MLDQMQKSKMFSFHVVMVQMDGRPPVVLEDFLLRLFFKLILKVGALRFWRLRVPANQTVSAKNHFENRFKLIDGQMNENEAEIQNLLDPNRFNKVPIWISCFFFHLTYMICTTSMIQPKLSLRRWKFQLEISRQATGKIEHREIEPIFRKYTTSFTREL